MCEEVFTSVTTRKEGMSHHPLTQADVYENTPSTSKAQSQIILLHFGGF